MQETLSKSDEKITIVVTGPLTNVASLILAHPEIKSKIERISWMGGTAVRGNVIPTAEFNAYVDPHAVEIVFRSGIPIVMSGLDVTEKAFITIDEMKNILDKRSEFTQKLNQMVEFYLKNIKKTPFHEENYDQVLAFHDVCAVMYLLKPQIFEGQDYFVEVELEGITAGTTVVDYMETTGKAPNVYVLYGVNREAFVAEFKKAVEIITERIQ
jgi:pyrimidine-specific ribonucleoside hydrolase